MRACAQCGGEIERTFRFCPWCAAPQRLKLVEFFRPHPAIERDRAKALRVSRYLGETEAERHVRFSVWDESGEFARAEAAVSLDEAEADRLADFLSETSAPTRELPADSTSR
jgi:hypothetical protein